MLCYSIFPILFTLVLKLTPWSTVVLNTLVVAQLFKNVLIIFEAGKFLALWTMRGAIVWRAPHQFIVNNSSPLLLSCSHCCPPIYTWIFMYSSVFNFAIKTICVFLPCMLHVPLLHLLGLFALVISEQKYQQQSSLLSSFTQLRVRPVSFEKSIYSPQNVWTPVGARYSAPVRSDPGIHAASYKMGTKFDFAGHDVSFASRKALGIASQRATCCLQCVYLKLFTLSSLTN